MNPSVRTTTERAIAVGVLVVAALGPLIFNDYWVNTILTQTFFFGVAAASLIFLSAYGGMISLAQAALYGIAGFALGNMVNTGAAKGMNLGWDPNLSIVLAILITVAVGLLFGALASRSFGIYFLMITLIYGLIVYFFFGQVTKVSGFSGISGMGRFAPDILAGNGTRLYYTSLVVAVLVYALIRFVLITPFGYALQGIRDDPVRMASLGYNVALHRTLAFGLGAFIAALSGILFAWDRGHIDPAAIGLQGIINLLIMAVIGGLARVEGAWLGAFAFIVINNYVRDVSVPILGGSFNTVVGFIFLAIVLVSPDGLMGIRDRLTTGRVQTFGAPVQPAAATSGGAAHGTAGQMSGQGRTEPPREGGGK